MSSAFCGPGTRPFSEGQDIVIARALAGRAAVDVDHARRYAREHGVARELQRSLLSEPRLPDRGIEIATRYLPAGQGALVGGDWFDAIPLGDGRHLKVIGDVMGHGVEAAVAMNHYRSLLRLLAEDGLPPHRVLERLDGAVERSGLDRGATCLLAVVDRRAGTCEVASAGHLPPVFIDPGPSGARVAHLQAGPPLGTGFGGYRSTTVPCQAGTVLFMYTDGLVERRGRTSTSPSNASPASPSRRAGGWRTCWTRPSTGSGPWRRTTSRSSPRGPGSTEHRRRTAAPACLSPVRGW